MDADAVVQNNRASIISDFEDALQHNTLIGACGREFIRVQRVKEWIRLKSNYIKLLDAAYATFNYVQLPLRDYKICHGRDCALLVFGILLNLGHGALIEFFYRHDFVDRHLPFRKWDLEEVYGRAISRGLFNKVLAGESAESLGAKFSARQYAFCPIIFQHKQGKDYNSDMVVPVAKSHKEAINDKGGTATVWQISILEEFVGPDLRTAIASSRYDPEDDGLGPRYRIALKSFAQNNYTFYETEKEAFLALTDQEGMIQYLGEFGHKDREENKSNYNILLEYGQLDLDEFFFDPGIIPPVLSEEINSFWDDIFDVAGALRDIHNFKVRRDDVSQEYYGWHADIKPDNVLRVNGKFKLADPGFASFKKVEGKERLQQRAEQREDATVVRGGTVTYGAPECHFGRHRQKPVTRAIDIWSLGCLFSVAATWVVLGQDGILQFTRLRERAINRLVAESAVQNHVERGRVLLPGDYFHNGINVLPTVTDWHKHLRCCIRTSDKTTSKVLDLIDQKMLCADPKARISASDLHKHFQSILAQSQAQTINPLPQSFRDALRELDDAVSPTSLQLDTRRLLPVSTANSVLTVEARKERKTILLGAPPKRTAHRSDALRSSQPMSQTSVSVSIQETIQEHQVPSPIVPTIFVETSEPSGYRRSFVDPASYQTTSARNSWIQNPQTVSAPAMTHVARRSTGGTDFSVLTRTSSAPPKLRRQNPWQARADLDRKKNTMAAISAKILSRPPKKDDYLTQYFGKRDLLFLIDNADSMAESWDEAMWLLNILLEKAMGQDENGMDMQFTNGSLQVDGSNKPEKFRDKMEEARPKKHNGVHTNICGKLGDILDSYLAKLRKLDHYNTLGKLRKLTIVIFTDGRWEGMTDKHAIGRTIANFAKDMKAIHGNTLRVRQVSFQFIQFGNDDEARYRLQRLDNDLPFEEAIPDIIDTIDSTGNVVKMLLGSFVEEFDTAD